ncbi:AraC family transcriptional regulator [Pleomorphomonas diazotrophica]|uniref:AraC family transcriptional regulator n=1 Tax=Pleomorphomonas diazotrophica TaxID=1166257 RepID=A0A1I4QUW8_9HYPH|nr:AraC family transcriptional regulator [Pleomorphomonas diazotrophica]PKR90429.1 AraC family transcriptional regulator [Pleomorphomonas diazotrophica]SFM43503.1 AraC-type DNA-binding protein [Pleomorphomonas diazotrophica]
MTDPLSDVIRLLRPRAIYSKGISGAGRWAVRYAEFGQPGFCAVTEGRCRLAVDGEEPVILEEGDFVLLPATPAFTMSGFEPAPVVRIDPATASPPDREVRHGRVDGPPDVRQFGGYFAFASPDADLLVSLLPRMIHIRGVPRLTQLVRLVGEEAARDDIGRDLILERLVEILLVEALRAAPTQEARPGLLRGLADPRIAVALRLVHGDVERAWTVPELARAAGMSRSAFFGRFTRTVGVRPMEYLLSWRMALAKTLLRNGDMALEEVARRIGYGSASTFSTAFSRHVGLPPGRFMRQAA